MPVFKKISSTISLEEGLRAAGPQASGDCRKKIHKEEHKQRGVNAQVVCKIGALHEPSGLHVLEVTPYEQSYSLLHLMAGKPPYPIT